MYFNWISLLPKLRNKIDIMFHGYFQDILLGTYLSRLASSSFLLDRKLATAKKEELPILLFKKINDVIPEKEMSSFYSKNFYNRIKNSPMNSINSVFENIKAKKAINILDSFMLNQIGRYHLSTQILRNYIEEISLAPDNELVDFCLQIPAELRYKTNIYYKFLNKLSPEMAKIPYQKTGTPIIFPMLIIKIGFLIKGGYLYLIRKIRNITRGNISIPYNIGYPDINEWIRKDNELKMFFKNMLLDKKTLSRGYFNSTYIINMFNDHMNAKKDYAKQLCALLTFELWNRLFID